MNENKRHILLVDDDPVLLRMYHAGLTQRGFEVETASDGLEAIRAARARTPDAVVLDIMMPKFTGVDFLKFFRGQPQFADVPVVVLSNSYMNDLGARAVALGVQQALLKMCTSPSLLAELLVDIFQGRQPELDRSVLLAVPEEVAKGTADSSVSEPERLARSPVGAVTSEASRLRSEFLRNAPKLRADLLKLCRLFMRLNQGREGALNLENLYRKVHFLTAGAGLARCQRLALLASALEAMLMELQANPRKITQSVLRTIASAVDLMDKLFDRFSDSEPEKCVSGRVLAVDDDRVCNQVVMLTLRHAGLEPRTTEDPRAALQWMHEERYDLILLDIEMPGMDGFELCRSVRALPGYRQTPVVFISSHTGFDKVSKVALAGGNDLIAKPVFPLELAVKCVVHLIGSRLPAPAPRPAASAPVPVPA